MEFNEENSREGRNGPNRDDERPKAWSVGDNDKSSKGRSPELPGRGKSNPVMEGQPMGGHNFGKNNRTSAANDKNNPSQYAGNTNPYFDRTEPMEEHPENSNFRPPFQEGRPDYDKAQSHIRNDSTEPAPEKVERGNGENDRPHKGGEYDQDDSEGGRPNIPGPNELPDQQKVGEDADEREHIET